MKRLSQVVAQNSPTDSSPAKPVVSSGVGILQSQVGEATTLSALPTATFMHPWEVHAINYIEWQQEGDPRQGWTFRMVPGFVNGIDPLCFGVFATGETASARDISRGRGSGLNRVGGAAREFGGGSRGYGDTKLGGGGEPAYYPLLQGPVIPVTSYLKSFTRIPPFFKEQGVKEVAQDFAAAGLSVNAAGGITMNLTPSAEEAQNQIPSRLLIGQDFWISIARAAYKSDVTLVGNLITGQIMDYSVGFDGSEVERVGVRPRLNQGDFQRMAFERESRRAEVRLRLQTGGPVDDPYDYQFLFTFWLLSPEIIPQLDAGQPGAPATTSPPLSQWEPYVEYGIGPNTTGNSGGGWWNFYHAAKNEPPFNAKQLSLSSIGALVGRYTFVPQATQGLLEAEQQRILNAMLNSTSNEGQFWN
jgi:hypothetical protein